MTKKRSIVQVSCRRCNRQTNHVVLFTHRTSGSAQEEGSEEVSWEDVYELLKCAGCEWVTLRRTFFFSESPEPDVTYYPPAVSRQRPQWRNKLKSFNLRLLVDEVYVALDADCRRLATMGARTIVDMVLVDKVGDLGRFPDKLKKLEEDGFVGRHAREILAIALDTGNAAAHRGHQPSKGQINQIMDIVENVLQAVYVLPRAAAELKKSTPPRR